ncbi:tetratricopeptide repeat protein [Aestuariibaculum lutulentum]|uniref:TonB C-terminal domain-containing protein n=1 Tax=Aestuariibaculum lutulentum TaxID=2920935 RepID=A0ABS9RIP7_9FLAO|nr:hypothetical protein [Aestuariibaculum lutulentum]MCH4552827.1 hypothetical protein [Aestuariibaculum lutulentum]
MRLVIVIVFFGFSLISNSQNSKEFEKLIVEGNIALKNGELKKAEEIYLKVLQKDSKNTDVLYNLALVEFHLENRAVACGLLQKSYKLKDKGAGKLIKEYCGDIFYNDFMFYEDVEVGLKFRTRGREYDLIKEGSIHPILVNQLSQKIYGSEEFVDFDGGKVRVSLLVDKYGAVKSRVTGGFENVLTKTGKEARMEVINKVFQEEIDFIPCQYQGKPVGMWSPVVFVFNLRESGYPFN